MTAEHAEGPAAGSSVPRIQRIPWCILVRFLRAASECRDALTFSGPHGSALDDGDYVRTFSLSHFLSRAAQSLFCVCVAGAVVAAGFHSGSMYWNRVRTPRSTTN